MTTDTADLGRLLPTAERPEGGRWASRPWLARSVRFGVVLLPFTTATMVAISLSAQLPFPPNLAWAALRIAFVAVVAALVYRVAERYVRRALPLASLLDLSLRFPDRAPSRLAMAMRVASTEDLSFLLDRYRQVGASEPAKAAEHLLELVAALSKHDRVTRGHSERVRAYTQMIGQQLGLSGVELDRLRWAGLIHDIGKLRIDADILNKPGRLTDEEFEIIKTHPALGAELAAPLAGWLGESVHAVGQHHERWDGKGYPLGLRATEISYAARIVSVADTFDVITSIRSYRHAASAKDAAAELARCAGTQFDPAVVRAFLALPLISVRRVMGPLSWLMSFLSGPSTWLPSWGSVGTATGSSVGSSAATAAGSSSAVVGAGAATAAGAATSVAAGAVVAGTGAAMSSGVGMAISLSMVSGVLATGIGTVAAIQAAPDDVAPPSAPPAAEVTLETVPPTSLDTPVVVTTPPPAAEQMGPIPPTTVPVVAVEPPPVVVPPTTSTPPKASSGLPAVPLTTVAGPAAASAESPSSTSPPSITVPPTSALAPAPITPIITTRSLTVVVSAQGAGSVSSSPGGIDCVATCTASFDGGARVTLTATAAPGWNFVGWTSSCKSETSSTCTVTMDQSRATTALFARASYDLTVNKQGSGTVSSGDGLLTCGAGCSGSVVSMVSGSTVTLTATPADGWAVDKWSSSCESAGSGSTCTVSMSQSRSTTVWFTRATFDISVVPHGQGVVTSSVGGLDCGAQCVATVSRGQSVSLTAVPEPGWKFAGWTSSCVDAGRSPTCVLVADADRSTSAFFVPAAFAFAVLTNGSGSVSAEVDGSVCNDACLAGVDNGASVTLTAIPSPGWEFVGWTSSCSSAGSSPTCTVVADGERSTTAMFRRSSFDLVVSRQGSGSVSSSVGGLDCGVVCSVPVANGASVTLTAVPAAGWVVGDWSNAACVDGESSCTLTMSQDQSTTVWFQKGSFEFTVNASGPGSVSATVDGEPCDAACLLAVPRGASVTLTAVPGALSGFSGWTSSCLSAGADPVCTLTADADRSTTAMFGRTAYAFTVNTSGASGSVSASVDGAPCSAGCLASVPAGTSVTFTAEPAVGSVFSTWSGACSSAGTNADCVVVASADRTVVASFVTQTVKFTVNASGPGSVSATVDGAPCDAACLAAVPRGASVTLTAVAAAKSELVGWSSSCESAGVAATCVLAATSDRSTTATFQRSSFDLTVSKDGSGTVTSSVGGLDCGSVCAVSVARGGSATLVASPAAGWRFDSWQGACAGSGASCLLSMSQDRTATAKFVPLTFDLSVSRQGSGTVTSSVGGLNCGSACTVPIENGAAVVLTATPATGFRFDKWSGACTGTSTTCQVAMAQALGVSVWFVPLTADLTLSKQGSGTVTSSVGGMNCGAGCTSSVVPIPMGTTVTLTATPDPGFAVDKWSNAACPGATTTCTLTMSQAQATTVWFVATGYALTVNKQGSGAITYTGTTINCTTGCASQINVPKGESVTITATPAAGWTVKWGKGCPTPATATATSCTVSSAWAVTVFFSPIVSVTKSAGGFVSSSDGVINCGSTCSAGVTAGTKVTLTATPDAGMKFTGWSGPCTGTALTCTFTVKDPATASNQVTANFAPI